MKTYPACDTKCCLVWLQLSVCSPVDEKLSLPFQDKDKVQASLLMKQEGIQKIKLFGKQNYPEGNCSRNVFHSM